MERVLKADLAKEKPENSQKKDGLLPKTALQKFKEKLTNGIVILGISVAVAIPFAVSCDMGNPNFGIEDASADTDMDTDMDSDSDTDVDTDSDSDSDTGEIISHNYWAEIDRGIWLKLTLNPDNPLEIEIDSSQESDTGDISNVFVMGDDFLGADVDETIWTKIGSPTQSGGWITLDTDGDIVHSITSVGEGHSFVMYCNATDNKGSLFGATIISDPVSGYGFIVQRGTWTKDFITFNEGHSSNTVTPITWDTSNTRYEIAWYNSTNVSLHMDDALVVSHSTNIATSDHSLILRNWGAETVMNCDYAYIKKSDITATITIGCSDLSATEHQCIITTDTNLTDYQVFIPYSEVGDIGKNLSITSQSE